MTPEHATALRAPFPAANVGKLPRITCPACSKASGRCCPEHRKSKCADCGNFITERHIHLDYVGHAETTDRLLTVDPEWSWQPVAFTEAGLPALDQHGGLWIRLTVCGVERYGYGAADGKTGPDAIKEAIGDAIRNAAMRFGVALDLWAKSDLHHDPDDAPPARKKAQAKKPAVQRSGTSMDAPPVVGDPIPDTIPAASAKTSLVSVLGGDKDKASELWGARGSEPISVADLDDLLGLAEAWMAEQSRPFEEAS